jgi:hypothetical protein
MGFVLMIAVVVLSANAERVESVDIKVEGEQPVSVALAKATVSSAKGQKISERIYATDLRALSALEVFEEVFAEYRDGKLAFMITGKKTADTPAALLHSLLCAMESKDYEAVDACMFPMKTGNFDMRKMIVGHLKNHSGKSTSGDYAYSHRAMIAVIRKYGTKFTKLDGFWKGQTEEIQESFPKLAAIDSSNFRMLHKGDLGIVIVKHEGGWKFVAWENLNSVLA